MGSGAIEWCQWDDLCIYGWNTWTWNTRGCAYEIYFVVALTWFTGGTKPRRTHSQSSISYDSVSQKIWTWEVLEQNPKLEMAFPFYLIIKLFEKFDNFAESKARIFGN
jgi:hypothetical protein